jgi:hypothetical protein
MKLLWTRCQGNALAIIRPLAVMLFVAGCAGTTQSPPPPDETQLLAAGFKVVVAKTPEQQRHLQALTPGKLTELQRNGQHFFVYPDASKNQIYVGTPKEYQAYQGTRPGYSTALTQQQAADLASYNKQDAAMATYTARDLADPYYFWPTFDGLWQALP